METYYYAFFDTMRFLLVKDGKILFLMTLTMMFALWSRQKTYGYRVLGSIPAVIAFALGKGAVFYWAWFPNTQYLFADRVTVWNFKDIQPYLSTIISVWLIFNILMDLYLIFGLDLRTILYSVLFLLGMAVQMYSALLACRENPALEVVNIPSFPGLAGKLLETRAVWLIYGLFGLISVRMIIIVAREGTKRQKLWLTAVIGLGALYLLFKTAARVL